MTAAVSNRSFPGARAIFALMLREMSTTYGRSPGGYVWAILEPVLAIALLAAIFSYAFRAPALGASFELFYATGYFPFMLYNDLSNKVGQSIKFNKNLLAYPNITYVDAIAARSILNTLTSLIVFALFFIGLRFALDLQLNIDVLRMCNAFLMTFGLGIGIGVVNCYVMSRFPIWTNIWTILNRPLFILSGILFLIDEISEPFRTYLLINPVSHIVMEMRAAFYPSYDASLSSPLYVYTLAAILLFFGFLLLNKHHRYIMDEGA
ncbi:ABC transporter permease [Shimia sp. SDUM112013]|uniref:ABC transporter permease n=1 Tax=Shimia sp. SDUM112013 TaxID=3136160 RepID=UPI0032EDE00E